MKNINKTILNGKERIKEERNNDNAFYFYEQFLFVRNKNSFRLYNKKEDNQ